MVSVLVPLAYLGFLFGSLSLFSRIYRGRQSKERKVNPWFGHHKARELYVSLLSLEQVPPRQILVAALLNRAKEDVKLIWSIRDAKQAMHQLLQKGQIGDETWETLLAAEKELEREIVEVVQEANTFQPGYGQQIFAVASDMAQHEKFKQIFNDIPKYREQFKQEGQKAAILAPYSHLSPSELTLSPSNPIQLATSQDVKKAAAVPEPPRELPVAPPSPKQEKSVPLTPEAQVSTSSKSSPAKPKTNGSQKEAETAATPSATSGAGTPASADKEEEEADRDDQDEDEGDEEKEAGSEPNQANNAATKTANARKRANQKKKKKGKR